MPTRAQRRPDSTRITLAEKRRAIELLGHKGLTQKETAAVLGRGINSIEKFMRDPVFREEVERARERSIAPTPVSVLQEALRSENRVDRIRAAVALLQHAPDAIREDDAYTPPEGAILIPAAGLDLASEPEPEEQPAPAIEAQ